MNPKIFAAIERLLVSERAPAGRRLLDLSVGDGASALRHQQAGFQVTASAYNVKAVKFAELKPVFVDLHQPLPFADAGYDLVCLQEVIEHLDNIPAALRDIARVLKPGGKFILTTPNMLNLRSRVRFLGTGFYRGRSRPIPRLSSEGVSNWNIVPFHLWWWLAARHGFAVEQLAFTHARPTSYGYLVLLYPWILLRTALICRGASPDGHLPAHRELRRHLLSRNILLSENLAMKWRRL